MNNIIQTIRHSARAAAVLLIALCAAQTAWAWDGQGTETNPYKITRASDLQQLAINVNNGTTYENVYFRQTAAIDMASETMTPIGNYDHPFRGHYDGYNFTISHLTITGSTLAALFGYANGISQGQTYHTSSLKNIVLTDCNIDVSSVTDSYAAGICAKNGSYNTVENCRVSGTIKGNYAAGGIVGQQENGNVQNCFADVTVTASVQKLSYGNQSTYCSVGKIIGFVVTLGSTVTGNYYHNDGATDGTNAAITAIGKGSTTTYPDAGRATPVYPVSAPSGLTFSGTPAATHDGKGYYAEGAVLTIGTGSADKVFSGFTATGATASSLAADRRSATVTVGTADVTVSATLQTVSGTTADGLTWSLAQDDSGNYTRLTVGGNGAMQNYDHTTDGKTTTWRTTAPWGYGLTSVTVGDGVTRIGSYAFIGCLSLAAATIGSSVATIGQQAFDHCDDLVTVTLPASVTTLGQGAFYNCTGLQRIDILHDGAVSLAANVFYNDNALQYITFPSPAALQANTTGNWSAYADKLRAKFGSQHFAVTTEGGTPAYAITTADDLRNLAAAVNATANISTGKTFRQTADIDLASGGNFTPIGERGGTYSFAGTYDGGSHTISGLTVSKEYSSIGLFGMVKGATVRNVILLSPTAKATTTLNNDVSLGALIGRCGSGSNNRVENCHVVNPTVSSSSTSSRNYVGAIIGNIWDTNNTVTNCYYYGGNANAAYGNNPNGATVSNVCAAHRITPADGVTIQTPMAADFGFTCDADNNGTAENYWRTGAQLTLGYTGTVPDGYTIGYTATNGGTINGSTLTMPDADVTVTATVSVTPWDGDGSKDKPYLIKYASQLDLLAHRVNGTHGENLQSDGYSGTYFQLANDITYDYTGLGDSESNFEAIGGDYNGNRYFRGHFDGNKKTISGIRIYKGGSSTADRYQGIFGRTDGADIHDLTLADARITGYYYTGGIVGYNNGTVTRCHVADDVAVCAVKYNAYCHGGIAGNNWGIIEQCTSAVTLTLTNANNSKYYGGIAGYNQGGTLRDNLAIGATVPAAANNTYGAITGNNNDGTLQRNYYAACKVADTENATGVGCEAADVTDNDGAVPGYLLTLGEGVTSSAWSITIPAHKELNSSGQLVTVAAVTYNVAAEGTTVWFNSGQPEGYSASYSVNGSPVSGNSITMPAAAVTVTVTSNGESIDLWGIADGANGNSDHPYTITKTEGWNLLVGNVAAGKSYSGKYFQLGADNISISTMVGTSACHFSGHFNGNGNTLAVNMTSAGEYTAPFRYVGGATITGLHTTGTVTTAHKYATGLVGRHNGDITISNCRSSVAIVSSVSGDGTHGGFVATGSGTATIEGCLFDGVICTTASGRTNSCGGFVGWNSGTVNISNSLYAPASVPEGKYAIGTDGCATFARNGVNSIANSYYTESLGDAQGKARHTVTAGTDVTVAHAGVATHYATSGITAYKATGACADSDPFIAGLLYNNNVMDVLYAGSGDAVRLTLSNTATGDVPEGYQYGYTTNAGTISGSRLTMPDEDVTVSVNTDVLRSTHEAVEVSYVDADGNTLTHDAIALDGTESGLGEGWYFVGLPTVAFDDRLSLYGDVHLILADGCTMNVTSDADGIDVFGSLTIYGQTDGTGTLNTTGDYGIYASYYASITISGGRVTATGRNGIYTDDSSTITITISGGRVTATGSTGYGIFTYSGTITISGGRVTVTGDNTGIYTNGGTITLGCTTASDFIYVSRYHVGPEGSLNIADDQELFDEDGNSYRGTINYYDYPDGKTLQPSVIALAAREAPDGNYWTTYYNSTLGTLHKLGKQIPAGTAVIIVADNNVVSMTAATDLDDISGTNDLRGVNVDTPVADIRSSLGDGTFYVLGMTTVKNEQHFGFHRYTGEEMAAHKAFVFVSGSQSARSLTMVFDEASGIESAEADSSLFTLHSSLSTWFTLDGRRLQAKPTAPGIYVNNGKKVVIK